MKHSDFHIGTEFFTAAGKWRCTDVGTRVIVAISLEPREIVRVHYTENKERFISNDPRDLLGPLEGTVYKPITARDMTDREKRNFRRLRR